LKPTSISNQQLNSHHSNSQQQQHFTSDFQQQQMNSINQQILNKQSTISSTTSISNNNNHSSSLFSLKQNQTPLPIWAERTLIFFKVFEQQCDILSTRKPVDLDNVQSQIINTLKEYVTQKHKFRMKNATFFFFFLCGYFFF